MPYLANSGMVVGYRMNQVIFLSIVITMSVILHSRTNEKNLQTKGMHSADFMR